MLHKACVDLHLISCRKRMGGALSYCGRKPWLRMQSRRGFRIASKACSISHTTKPVNKKKARLVSQSSGVGGFTKIHMLLLLSSSATIIARPISVNGVVKETRFIALAVGDRYVASHRVYFLQTKFNDDLKAQPVDFTPKVKKEKRDGYITEEFSVWAAGNGHTRTDLVVHHV